MELGTFSVSLTVADMAASRKFYEALGFAMIGGDGDNWAILANGSNVIGLFQGMFESNILTFNPGWSGPGTEAEEFTDIREIKKRLADAGIEVDNDSTEDSSTGPASFTIADPDGNAILLDQHV